MAGINDAAEPGIELMAIPVPVSSGPASLMQEGVWFVESMRQQQGAYNESVVLHLRGSLDVAVLERALSHVIARHAALRTCFVESRGGLVQCVASLPSVVLSVAPALQDDEQSLASWIKGVTLPGFNLRTGPLFRAELGTLASDHHVLVIAVHHIVVDGWSLGIFRRDLSAFYGALVRQVDVQLPEILTTPSAYSARQRAFVASAAGEAAGRFWCSQLRDRPLRPLLVQRAGMADHAVHERLAPPQALIDGASALARQARTSVFVVMLSAVAVALAKMTGEKDLVIATDFSDRGLPELEPMIGLLVNQLPLRLNIGHVKTTQALLAHVHGVCIAALTHKDLPYPMIARACKDVPGAGAEFAVKFVLHSMPMHTLDMPGLAVEQVEIEPMRAKFPLLIELWDAQAGMRGDMVGSAHYTDSAWLGALHRGLFSTLEQMVADPGASIFPDEAGVPPPVVAPAAFIARRVPVAVGALARIVRNDVPGALPATVIASHAKVDARAWVRQSAVELNNLLVETGAVLLRGFHVDSAQHFSDIVRAFNTDVMDYVQCSTPRIAVLDKVYTSTEYPADQEIFFHNENSYASVWPEQIAFWCDQPAAAGGRTPIADGRKVLASLPGYVKEAFESRGLLYRRQFSPGMGIAWEQTFGVRNRSELQERFGPQGYQFEWLGEHTLVARFRAPAVVTHPVSGDRSWFNHASLFHRAALPEMLRRHFQDHDPDGMATSTFFGDGEPIPDSWIEIIRDTYRRNAVHFDWQQGDILLLDNRLMAHGRETYTPPRRILVSMAGGSRH
ncbi:condensation domain-containing protein [Pseudomonas sp. S3E17]|uniref:condensation domain-containing protein n=1 Tax=Pseudomonas sp. S3E17 TaxID=2817893 RepID=UPI0020A04B60|nr:condensation domain-containing protein [Pseudomonas sp. S3E17]MCP1462297.1 alpha-ketoglutarate-dependent taurine dioxygenase [Pseudomonas sp. S3E17]